MSMLINMWTVVLTPFRLQQLLLAPPAGWWTEPVHSQHTLNQGGAATALLPPLLLLPIGDTVFALVVGAPKSAFDKDAQALQHIQDTFKLL